MSKYIGLDLSSVSSGWCYWDAVNQVPLSWGLIHTDYPLALGIRLDQFHRSLANILWLHPSSAVIIEDIYCANHTTFKVLAQFRGVALQCIYANTGLEPVILPVSKVRKLIGAGKDKLSTFNFINGRFNMGLIYERANDITDAVALCLAYSKLKEQK